MTATLLIADDDVSGRAVIAEFLRDAGYDVLEAGSADEAVAVFETGAAIDLLFSDVRIPGSMDGCALARRVADRWPDTRILLTSASGSAETDSEISAPFLPKPYRPLSLLGKIMSLVDQRERL